MSESLQARVAARRQQRKAHLETRFVLTIPGYRDMLAVRYKVLTFEEKAPIIERHEITDQGLPVDKVGSSLDLLINSCVDILEVTGKDENGEPQYQSLGTRWTPGFVQDHFGVEIQQGVSLRDQLREALDGDEVMEHFNDWSKEQRRVKQEADGVAEGEAEPSAEG